MKAIQEAAREIVFATWTGFRCGVRSANGRGIVCGLFLGAVGAIWGVERAVSQQPDQPSAGADALVVTPKGTVGIGISDPEKALEVNGEIKATTVSTGTVTAAGTVTAKDVMAVTGTVTAKDLTASGNVKATGNMTATGTVTAKELTATGNVTAATGNVTAANVVSTGNVTVANGDVRAKKFFAVDEFNCRSTRITGETIAGTQMNATVINGEQAPYTFEIGNNSDTTNWHAVQVDGKTIFNLLGDADGGTITILIRQNSTGFVRRINCSMYYAQPGKSKIDPSKGLEVFTYIGQNGEHRVHLKPGDKTKLFGSPTDWVEVRNYMARNDNWRGLPGKDSAPWGADPGTPHNEYRMEFITRPNVSATIVIYDR